MTDKSEVGYGVIEEVINYILEYLTTEGRFDCIYSGLAHDLAKFLFDKGIRPTKEKGMIIVEGEVSIVPPECVEKLKSVLG